jgi:dCTP deaminase
MAKRIPRLFRPTAIPEELARKEKWFVAGQAVQSGLRRVKRKTSMLVDSEINQKLKTVPPLATQVPLDDFTRAASKIQAASLDLTIGEIYLPGSETDKPGGASSPITMEMTLRTGQTAVIRTREVLHLAHDLAAIGFPPARLSLRGLLMTNPGHIDPGYHGPLHLTVINMSRVPFPLAPGNRIMRVLFMRLAPNPDAPYDARDPTDPAITPELLGNLSADFVNVQERAQQIADDSVRRANFRATAIPLAVAILTVFGTIWANTLSKPEIQGLSERLVRVETNRPEIQGLSDRLVHVEAKIDQQALEDRIRKLEDAAKSPRPTKSR